MGNRVLKNIFILSLVLLLVLQQGSYFIGAAAPGTDNNMRLILELDGQATSESTVVNIKQVEQDTQEDEGVQKVELHVPQGATFDAEKTKALGQGQANITYNADTRKVTFEWNEALPKQQAKAVFKDLVETNYLFIAEGVDGGAKVKSNELLLQMPVAKVEQPESAEDSKAVEDSKETGESTVTNEPKEPARNESSDAAEEPKNKSVSDKQKAAKQNDEQSITPFAGNLNVDIDISPVRDSVESGRAAQYILALKFTGSQKEYTNAKIVVDLPNDSNVAFTQDLKELIINGVVPAYNSANHTLTYEFDSIKAGRSYEIVIKVDTENGPIKDGTTFTAKASFEAAEQSLISDSADVKVNASGSIALNKNFFVVKDNVTIVPVRGSETLWKITVDIPKKKTGQKFIKEGTEITVTDTIPTGFTYHSTEEGPEAVTSGTGGSGSPLKATWRFEAPTIVEQKEASDSLFKKEIIVNLKVDNNATIKEYTNKADAKVTFMDDETLSADDSAIVGVATNNLPTPDPNGAFLNPLHIGPTDGEGNAAYPPGSNQNHDPNPGVYDWATLTFAHDFSPLNIGMIYDFREYNNVYKIDQNLIFEELKTPAIFYYRPVNAYPANIIHPEQPEYDLYATIDGTERLLVKDAEAGKVYTRQGLSLLQEEHVSQIRYSFTKAPAGMITQLRTREAPTYTFTVKKGARGSVANSLEVYGKSHLGEDFTYRSTNTSIRFDTTVSGPRHAKIQAPLPGSPMATIKVDLLGERNGAVVSGTNRVRVEMENRSASNSNITMYESLESVILLPKGVTLNAEPNASYNDRAGSDLGAYEVLSENHNASGRQLVKITWSDRNLRPGNHVAAELDVTIASAAPTSLPFDVYGFSGDNILRVPTSQGTSITDTILQVDTDDLNVNGNNTQPRLKSGNIYVMRGQYEIQTEKLVKGELDDEYSDFGKTLPGGKVDYKLKVTNTTGQSISKMTLIDVLPSVGDLGITDNVARGSQFTPTLKNTIHLPAEWVDKVNVVYSTAKNPKRDELTKNTIYPDTTEKLENPPGAETPNWMTGNQISDWSTIHSFKIELKDGVEWIQGDSIVIDFNMKAPAATDVSAELLDSKVDAKTRAAWNSFAIATNHGQPVEPFRVGVAMDYEVVEPTVEKSINDEKTLQLVNRDELFTWKVKNDFGNYTSNWDSVVLSDQIHALLDIKSVKVENQDGNDVTANGVLTTVDNLVKFEANKQNGSFAYLADQTYTLIIESKIKSSATNEQLQPFVDGNGIPNQSVLTIDNDSETSNEVFVKPPGRGALEITKVDDKTGVVLQHAEFDLLQACEDDSVDPNCKEGYKVIASGVTEADGKLLFEDLPLGDYKLVETKAPEGYAILTAPLDITITESGQALEFEVENTKTGWDLPTTGGMGTILFYVIGALLMIGAALFLLRKRTTNV